jgi:hypothetical protein
MVAGFTPQHLGGGDHPRADHLNCLLLVKRSIVLSSLFPVDLDVFGLLLVNARHGVVRAAQGVQELVEFRLWLECPDVPRAESAMS